MPPQPSREQTLSDPPAPARKATSWISSDNPNVTLWLHDILGNGMLAALIVTAVMLGIPALWKRLRS